MLCGVNKHPSHRGVFIGTSTLIQVSCNYATGKSRKQGYKLPKLPVPKLKDTMTRYIQTVKPFLNETEFKTTRALVKDFESGWGKLMQIALEKRAKDRENWLDEWWLNVAYLEHRKPLVVYSSPGVFMPAQKFKSQEDQLHYTAKLLLGTLDFKYLIDHDKLPREKMGKKPLDMGQYKKVLGTCRLPLKKRDKLSYNADSRHIAVIHNNQFFRVDLWGSDNVELSENQIVDQLKEVIKQSGSLNNDGLGYLTSENRDTWADAYQILLKDKTNKEALEHLEKSIVAVCLDRPSGLWKCSDDDCRRTLIGTQALHGGGTKSNGGNRWFDKALQFIVGAEGLTGISYEHSPADGVPVAVLVDYVIKYMAINKTITRPSSKSPKAPLHLKFQVTPEVTQMIKKAKDNLNKLSGGIDLNCFQYTKYGKGFIKSQKLSPDSYLQMAMQYAFYRLYKVPGATYESAATRMFLGGRTDTIRSCSLDSIAFCKTMLNTEVSANEKVEALRRAIRAHKKTTVAALQGYGVDRHLLGLRLTAVEHGVPLHKLYSDPSYTRSSHMRISTSQIRFKADAFMCYGPRVDDGYANCYNPRTNDFIFALSAFQSHPDTATAKYRQALEQSLEDMHEILLQRTTRIKEKKK